MLVVSSLDGLLNGIVEIMQLSDELTFTISHSQNTYQLFLNILTTLHNININICSDNVTHDAVQLYANEAHRAVRSMQKLFIIKQSPSRVNSNIRPTHYIYSGRTHACTHSTRASLASMVAHAAATRYTRG